MQKVVVERFEPDRFRSVFSAYHSDQLAWFDTLELDMSVSQLGGVSVNLLTPAMSRSISGASTGSGPVRQSVSHPVSKTVCQTVNWPLPCHDPSVVPNREVVVQIFEPYRFGSVFVTCSSGQLACR